VHSRVLVDGGCDDLLPLIGRAIDALAVGRIDVVSELQDRASDRLARTQILMVGCRSRTGVPSEALVDAVRHRHPHIAIYLCARDVNAMSPHVRAHALAGTDRAFALGDSPGLELLRAAVSVRVRAPAPELELRGLVRLLPPSQGRTIGLHCIRNSHVRYGASDVASWFGVDRATTNNRLAAAGLPSVLVCRAYGRLFHAKELERRGERSREQIARLLQVDSAAALRVLRARLVRRLAGGEPGRDLLEQLFVRPTSGAFS